ncbi:MAG: response regulator transcription factor [Bacteroidota bacterium]
MKTQTFSIFISDPHAIFREGIKKTISGTPGLVIAGESENVSGLLEAVRKTTPDLLLIYTIPFKASIEVAVSMLEEFPALKIALLTNITRHPDLYTAFNKGIAGIIYKAVGEKELLTAFEELRKGNPYFSPEVLPYLTRKQPPGSASDGNTREEWSEKEIFILKCIGKGCNNPEIARLLNLKERSIEGYKSRMMEKACVPNTVNLMLYALRNKLITIRDI